MVGPDQRGQAGKMVVVRMGVEDAVDLVDADAQGVKSEQDVAGVDQIARP